MHAAAYPDLAAPSASWARPLPHLSGDGNYPLFETFVPPRIRLQAGLDHIKGDDGEMGRRAPDCTASRKECKIDSGQRPFLYILPRDHEIDIRLKTERLWEILSGWLADEMVRHKTDTCCQDGS